MAATQGVTMKDDLTKRLLANIGRGLGTLRGLDDGNRALIDCCFASSPKAAWQWGLAGHLAPEIWEPFVRHIVGLRAWHMRSDLEYHARRCESPIEGLLFLALIVVGERRTDGPAITDGSEVQPFDAFGAVSVQSQVQVGKHRIDMQVSFGLTNVIMAPNEIDVHEWRKGTVLVECDGHDFHEKTKQQASSDRRRDRELQAAGFPVFRFTGSDVWNRPIECAAEVVEEAYRRAQTSAVASTREIRRHRWPGIPPTDEDPPA